MPNTIIRLFDGTYSSTDAVFNDPNFDNIVNVLYTATQFDGPNRVIEYVMGKDANISATSATSPIVRGNMAVGYPLEGFVDIDEDQEDQDDEFDDYIRDTLMDLADNHYDNGVGPMDFYYGSARVISVFITAQVISDIALVGGSFGFIFGFMWFMTQSLFKTSFGLFSIVNCFVITDILYIGVFQIKYLGIFHCLSLFIVLGIGADDFFVFMDTWNEAQYTKWPTLAHRMDHTFRHAGQAMLYTSTTTAIAFFVSATSPLLAINSFGLFSGVLIIVNYLSVITYFPSVVIVYHLYFDKYQCLCCCPKNRSQKDKLELPPDKKATNEPEKKNVLVRFFAGPYFRFITHKVVRWVIIFLFSSFMVVMAYFITQVEVQEEQVRIFAKLQYRNSYKQLENADCNRLVMCIVKFFYARYHLKSSTNSPFTSKSSIYVYLGKVLGR